MPRSLAADIGGPNLCAALDTIAWSELGAQLLKLTDDGYNVIVTSTPSNPILFEDYSKHPNRLMHFVNKRGIGGNSTAAGRYQCLNRFAVAYITSLKLPDFGPESQDKIALKQIKEQGAYLLFQQGKFTAGIERIKNIWASLPGAGYDQHEQSFALLEAIYVQKGGQIFSA